MLFGDLLTNQDRQRAIGPDTCSTACWLRTMSSDCRWLTCCLSGLGFEHLPSAGRAWTRPADSGPSPLCEGKDPA